MTETTSKRAVLVLEDGSTYIGYGFGASTKVVGEVVFSTSMVGYTEALTDPSYMGQILLFTYPLIGNYGVPSLGLVDEFNIPLHFESFGIKVSGVVISDLCIMPSHWASSKSFNEWLLENGVPGIFGVDTRSITKKLRSKGVMMGLLYVFDECVSVDSGKLFEELKCSANPIESNLVEKVSIKEPIPHYIGSDKNVVVIDCGVKLSIIRNLLRRGVNVIRVPYNFQFEDILSYKPHGVLISNGPGDPALLTETIATVREIVDSGIPIFGICLGNQILALALGGLTYKLRYGHRSQNQPVLNIENNTCFITSQNHGFAVDASSLKDTKLKVWYVNANDGTVEGIRHMEKDVFSVQWHPEGSPGPLDTCFLFDVFIKMLR